MRLRAYVADGQGVGTLRSKVEEARPRAFVILGSGGPDGRW